MFFSTDSCGRTAHTPMDLLQQTAAVAFVLTLLGGSLYFLRRRGYAVSALGRRGGGRRLECVERVALGPQQTLHLVRLGDRALVVAASPSGCALLQELAWKDIAPPEGSR